MANPLRRSAPSPSWRAACRRATAPASSSTASSARRSSQDVDPFLMLDEFRSDDAADYIAGFPDHPHRGFETVTYMLAGRMRHGDNNGHTRPARRRQRAVDDRRPRHRPLGDAGAGKRPDAGLPALGQPAGQGQDDGAALSGHPAARRSRWPSSTAASRSRSSPARIGGVRGPIDGIATEPVLLDVALPTGGRFALPLPAGHSVFLYPFEGDIAGRRRGDARRTRQHRRARSAATAC